MRYKLRHLREHRVLTQRDLAALTGVAQSTIAAIESGDQRARPVTLRKLAAALGVEPHELIEDEEERAA